MNLPVLERSEKDYELRKKIEEECRSGHKEQAHGITDWFGEGNSIHPCLSNNVTTAMAACGMVAT